MENTRRRHVKTDRAWVLLPQLGRFLESPRTDDSMKDPSFEIFRDSVTIGTQRFGF